MDEDIAFARATVLVVIKLGRNKVKLSRKMRSWINSHGTGSWAVLGSWPILLWHREVTNGAIQTWCSRDPANCKVFAWLVSYKQLMCFKLWTTYRIFPFRNQQQLKLQRILIGCVLAQIQRG
jgi:hypothetical protein